MIFDSIKVIPDESASEFDSRSISSSYLSVLESWAINKLTPQTPNYLIVRTDEYDYRVVVGKFESGKSLSGISARYYRIQLSQYVYEWRWETFDNYTLSANSFYQSDITNVYSNISTEFLASDKLESRLSVLTNTAFNGILAFSIVLALLVSFINHILWKVVSFVHS